MELAAIPSAASMTDSAGRQTTPDNVIGVSTVVLKKSPSIEALKDITCGSIAGMIGKTIEYPFDTVKVRLQSQSESLPLRYKGPIDCFRQSFLAEGLKGLYRGVSAPMFGAAVETSSLFFSYRVTQNILQSTIYSSSHEDALPLGALVVCGAASGAFTSILLTPIELVKCQMQVPAGSSSHIGIGPMSVIASVYRHHGVSGFWYGQLGTLIRETGGSAAWFGGFEGVSLLFRHYNPPARASEPLEVSHAAQLPIWQQMLAGAAAGVSYNFLFYPADTIKSRMQTEEVSKVFKAKRKTFWEFGTTLWRQQGVKGLYRGCGITMARSAPSSALIFAGYGALRNWFE